MKTLINRLVWVVVWFILAVLIALYSSTWVLPSIYPKNPVDRVSLSISNAGLCKRNTQNSWIYYTSKIITSTETNISFCADVFGNRNFRSLRVIWFYQDAVIHQEYFDRTKKVMSITSNLQQPQGLRNGSYRIDVRERSRDALLIWRTEFMVKQNE